VKRIACNSLIRSYLQVICGVLLHSAEVNGNAYDTLNILCPICQNVHQYHRETSENKHCRELTALRRYQVDSLLWRIKAYMTMLEKLFI
jgi:hypothetical protein